MAKPILLIRVSASLENEERENFSVHMRRIVGDEYICILSFEEGIPGIYIEVYNGKYS